MNWKDYPHLFANGKFKMAYNDEKYPSDVWAYYQPDQFHLFDNEAGMSDFIALKDCTLIARKIEDMTDEEKEKWKSFYHENYMHRMIPCYANQTAYLLSIGVYPFDQKAFETGEVLDAKEAV